MPKDEAKHRFEPHPEWINAVTSAWESLGPKSGRKTKVLARADLGRSTVSRISNDLSKVGYDALESLRLALNAELGTKIPPAFMAMRSTEHHALAQLAAEVVDRDGKQDKERLAKLAGWAEIGITLAKFTTDDEYDQALEKIRELAYGFETKAKGEAARARAEASLSESTDSLSAPLRSTPTPPSDRPGKTVHGAAKARVR